MDSTRKSVEVEVVDDLILEALMILFQEVIRREPTYEAVFRSAFEEPQRVIVEMMKSPGFRWADVERELPGNAWVELVRRWRESHAELSEPSHRELAAARKSFRALVRKRRQKRHLQ